MQTSFMFNFVRGLRRDIIATCILSSTLVYWYYPFYFESTMSHMRLFVGKNDLFLLFDPLLTDFAGL